MDYQDEFDIPNEFPDEFENNLPSAKSSNKISSPINSSNRFFEAFPSDFRKKQKVTHFKNNQEKQSAISSKHRTSQDGSKSRSLKQFLDFQKSFEQEKERKLNLLKQQQQREEAYQCRNTPAINSHSRRLTSHLQSTCYERLSKQKTFEHTITEPEPQFHPKILNKSKSLRRKQNVSELLYDDAQRRIQKQKFLQKQVQIVKPKINANTDRLVVRALKTQFQSLVKNIKQLTPEASINILSKLFNADLNQNDEAFNQKRYKILEYLFKNKSTINTKRLWTFIEISTGTKQTNSVFSEKQQKLICKQFKHFLYRNRMTKQRQKTYEDQPTFRPQILKNSQKLAKRKRQKMVLHAQQLLQKQNVRLNVSDTCQIPIADLYILQRIHNQQQNKMKKENGQAQQFSKCTFKPQLNKWSGMKDIEIFPMSTKSSRARQMFNKKNQQTQNTLLFTANTMDSIEFSRQQRKRSGSHSSLNKSIRQVKNMQSTLFRMSAGRRQKQFISQFQQRGYPKDIQNWQQFRKSQKRIIQTSHRQLKGYDSSTPNHKKSNNSFIFDIHVSKDKIETIHLNKSDDIIDKVQQLSYKYDLTDDKKLKLVKMIRSNLCAYLDKGKQNLIL